MIFVFVLIAVCVNVVIGAWVKKFPIALLMGIFATIVVWTLCAVIGSLLLTHPLNPFSEFFDNLGMLFTAVGTSFACQYVQRKRRG
jgi:hypothetical protein